MQAITKFGRNFATGFGQRNPTKQQPFPFQGLQVWNILIMRKD